MGAPKKLMPDLQQAVRCKTISEVWLKDSDAPTPVSASELFYSTAYDFGIEERVDGESNVRVSTLFVP